MVAGLSVRAILIAGPTASGKSAVALALAERLGGAVINADSMQVYRDLHVITARPTAEEESRAPHWLYGCIDAAETHSAGRWLRDAGDALAQTAAGGRVPILVGGTGLYFKLLIEGIATIPPIPATVRQGIRARLDRDGPEALHAALAQRDPAGAARVRTTDRSRIVRALEVFEATGRPLVDWHSQNAPPLLSASDTVRVFLAPERDDLNARIDARFRAMLEAGAADEARLLAARALDPHLPAMKAHGVPWLIRHQRGEISLADAVAGSQSDTRRYAKRQFTWFRNQMPGWDWVAPERALDHVLTRLLRR